MLTNVFGACQFEIYLKFYLYPHTLKKTDDSFCNFSIGEYARAISIL